MIKITIRNHWKEIILETTDETYEKDLADNKEKLEVWWNCGVEYEDGTRLFDYACNHNGLSPRRVIIVNERTIYAEYNFSIEVKKNVYDDLMKYFDEDFKTNIQPKTLIENKKENRKWEMETTSPLNKNIKPVDNNLKEDLIDG